MASNVDFEVFDCDNHYYEAIDAFTRHTEKGMASRTMQWAEINGRQRLLVGGKVNRFIPNPTWDPISKPGALDEYFRGRNPKGEGIRELFGDLDPLSEHPEYLDRDARLKLMDEQGMGGAIFLPTLGVGMEQALLDDPPALLAAFRAFNRWLDDDWGFDYQGRVFASPYITLADLDWAIRELEWALEHGARTVVMRPAAPHTRDGQVPVSDPRNDPFWARVNEAGITVVAHAGDSGYSSNGYARDGFAAGFSGGGWAPSVKAFHIERAAHDFLVTLVFDKLFDRFPSLRIASVENGADFLRDLFKKLRGTDHKMPGYFTEDPIETFRRNIWINPFWEDDVHEVVEHMGIDRVIFGSDWPHIEGMPRPLDYAAELKAFDEVGQRKILRDNVRMLNTLSPA
jgi:predicted TIM-barrel fold metal-dependent hydrolase